MIDFEVKDTSTTVICGYNHGMPNYSADEPSYTKYTHPYRVEEVWKTPFPIRIFRPHMCFTKDHMTIIESKMASILIFISATNSENVLIEVIV